MKCARAIDRDHINRTLVLDQEFNFLQGVQCGAHCEVYECITWLSRDLPHHRVSFFVGCGMGLEIRVSCVSFQASSSSSSDILVIEVMPVIPVIPVIPVMALLFDFDVLPVTFVTSSCDVSHTNY